MALLELSAHPRTHLLLTRERKKKIVARLGLKKSMYLLWFFARLRKEGGGGVDAAVSTRENDYYVQSERVKKRSFQKKQYPLYRGVGFSGRDL